MSAAKPPFVPERFQNTVAVHIISNIIRLPFPVPLILGIFGPSGAGKTYQCEHTLESMGIPVVVISAAELEHQQAGRPGQLIRDRYLYASKIAQESQHIAALLINDIDTGVGMWAGHNKPNTIFQYTINLQIVHATLMNLADNPTLVETVECSRIPIIVTGNDWRLLHAPLTRDGRMRKFHWTPTTNEKLAIVKRMLSDIASGETSIALVDAHPEQPIAFFAQLRSLYVDRMLNAFVTQHGLQQCIGAAKALAASSLLSTSMDRDDLLSLAAAVAAGDASM